MPGPAILHILTLAGLDRALERTTVLLSVDVDAGKITSTYPPPGAGMTTSSPVGLAPIMVPLTSGPFCRSGGVTLKLSRYAPARGSIETVAVVTIGSGPNGAGSPFFTAMGPAHWPTGIVNICRVFTFGFCWFTE